MALTRAQSGLPYEGSVWSEAEDLFKERAWRNKVSTSREV